MSLMSWFVFVASALAFGVFARYVVLRVKRHLDDLRQRRKSIVVKMVRRLEAGLKPGEALFVGRVIRAVAEYPDRRRFFGASQAMLDYCVADALEELKKDDMVFLKTIRVNGRDCQTCGLSERVKIIDAQHATTVVA